MGILLEPRLSNPIWQPLSRAFSAACETEIRIAETAKRKNQTSAMPKRQDGETAETRNGERPKQRDDHATVGRVPGSVRRQSLLPALEFARDFSPKA